MSDFISTLCNLRLLKATLKDVELSTLEIALEKLTLLVEEKRKEKEAIEREQELKNGVVNDIRNLLENSNLTIDELTDLLKKGKIEPQGPIKRNVPPKYIFTDKDGNEQTWTGQGRTPSLLKECMLRENKPIEAYLVKSSQKEDN